jgi:hypothetical protein
MIQGTDAIVRKLLLILSSPSLSTKCPGGFSSTLSGGSGRGASRAKLKQGRTAKAASQPSHTEQYVAGGGEEGGLLDGVVEGIASSCSELNGGK